jgi:tripartite-type tricarboxylate transporter receptor subunit TctC
MRKLLITAGFALAWASVGIAHAQIYPSHPITMVVPVPAGGAFDVTARVIAEHMRASLGRAIIVENVTGAAGSIGTGQVARAAPDGYTLIFGGLNTHVINPAFLALHYNVLNDFEPVALTATVPLLIVAKKSMPANNLKELIAWLKANPDKASLGTGGRGNVSHLAAVFFQTETGTRMGIVPYRAAGWACRCDDGSRIELAAPCARRHDQSLCGLSQDSSGSRAGHRHRGRSRLAWLLHGGLAGGMGAETHSESRDRKAECIDHGGLG